MITVTKGLADAAHFLIGLVPLSSDQDDIAGIGL
jgi:hypothetical protein